MDWLSVYQFVVQKYPLDNRTGIVSSAIVKHYFPEYNSLLQKLGVKNAKSMCEIVEGKKLMNYDAGIRTTMTANTFFDYCKIAYCTLSDDNNKLSGKELYEQYADGRDDGLLDINPDSEKEFADWIDDKHPKKSKGGHPWEIRRGGNTSNIQLTIRRPNYRDKTSFSIEIYPTGNSRLAETIKMFLAIYEAGLPITISKYDFIREQLLGFDNFAIMPQYQSLHRATQSFSEEKKVSNVLYLSNLKEHLSKIRPLISWEELPILKPKLA
jgi:hypothetical protein